MHSEVISEDRLLTISSADALMKQVLAYRAARVATRCADNPADTLSHPCRVV